MKLVVIVTMIMGTAFLAEARSIQPNLEKRVNRLENQNERLKTRIRNINQRLKDVEIYLEGGNGGSQPPGGGAILGVACMLKDSAGEAHVGTGSSQMDAEYKANKSCQAKTFGSRCRAGKLTCQEITTYSKSQCLLTDSGGDQHIGEGENEVLAKANVIKQCMKVTFGSRCNAGAIRCEKVY